MQKPYSVMQRILMFLLLIAPFANATALTGPCDSGLSDRPEIIRFKKLMQEPTSTEEVLPSSSPHGPVSIVHGVPKSMKLVTLAGSEVFRHYTPPEARKLICAQSELVAGSLPYIETGFGRTTFVDLTGIFLTKPEFTPLRVGVGAELSRSYVDFTLPEGTQILEVSTGIWLIPGAQKLPEWVRESYSKWEKDKSSVKDPGLLRTLVNIEKRGGLVEPTRQKILLPQSPCGVSGKSKD